MLLFSDAFDSYNTGASSTEFPKRWDAYGSLNSGYSATLGRTGGGCLTVGTNSIWKHLVPAVQLGTSLFVAASVYFASFGTEPLVYFGNERGVSGTNQQTSSQSTIICVGMTAAGRLFIGRNSLTAIATSTNAFAINTWYRLEIKITGLDDADQTIEVRVNGVTEISFTGDLYTAGGKEIASVGLWPNRTRFDDVLIYDSTGSSFNDFLGDILMETVRPNGAGTYTNSTPSTGAAYAAVDDPYLQESDYTAIDTVNLKDTYAYGPLTATPTSIQGVVVTAQVKSSGTVERRVRAVVRLGTGEEADSAAEQAVPLDASPTGFKPKQFLFDAKPAGGAWTKADIDSAEFGWKVTA